MITVGSEIKDNVIVVHNNHAHAAPTLNSSVVYASYFENEHAEQAIFVKSRDADSDRFMVYLGDTEWSGYDVRVVRNHALVLDKGGYPIVLTNSEAKWIESCLAANNVSARVPNGSSALRLLEQFNDERGQHHKRVVVKEGGNEGEEA